MSSGVTPDRFRDVMWASGSVVVGLKNHWLGDLGQAANPLWTSFSLSLKIGSYHLSGLLCQSSDSPRMCSHHPERCRNESAEIHSV